MDIKAKKFYDLLYSDKPETHQVYIWTLPDKISHFFVDHDHLTAKAELLKNKNDIYYGIGTSPKDFGKFKRCAAKDIAGIPCLWLDVDIINDKAHSKENLFKTTKDAIEFLKKIPLEPTAIINSGNGLHVYWIFNEFWDFGGSDVERVKAAKLAALWNLTIKELAYKNHRIDLDSTFDLARVFRVPDTFNLKNDKKKPVRIIKLDEEKLYNPEDFEPYLNEQEIDINLNRKTEISKSLILSENAQPPLEKFQALLENSDIFKDTFEGKNKKIKDQSASGYDMSLANQAAAAGWTDQEIIDLLIFKRNKFKQDLKLRENYYKGTIYKVRKTREKAESLEGLETMEFGPGTPKEPETEAEKEQIMDETKENLAAVLNIDIIRVIKFLGEQPSYRIVTQQGEFTLGNIENLIEYRYFKRRVAEFLNIMIPPYSAKEWDNIAQALLSIIEEKEIGSENTTKGEVQIWLDRYLADYEPATIIDDDILISMNPFYKDDGVYIFGPALREWLNKRGDKIPSKVLGQKLRIYGAKPETINCTINEKPTTRSVWRLP